MSTTQTYAITGMTCGHCEEAVRSEVAQIPGVSEIDISVQTGLLSVTAEGTVDDDAVLAAVDEAGYAAARS